ncbi:MAG: AHH domain-containing protein [Corallincola sp.]|nr:AHH domain-containing protein [Corallincola sp.]
MRQVVSPPPIIPSPRPSNPTALELAIHRFEEQANAYHYEKTKLAKATGQPSEIAKARAKLDRDWQHLQRERLRISTQAGLQRSLEDYRKASKQKTKDELQAEPHHPARVLARHLTAVGEPKPSRDHDPHHIIAGKGRFMPEAMEQARLGLHMHGIGINDAINGVWLPRSKADKGHWATPESPAHREIHRHNYEMWIWRLFGATLLPENVVRQRLRVVKLKLRLGGYPSEIVQPKDPQRSGNS